MYCQNLYYYLLSILLLVAMVLVLAVFIEELYNTL